MTSNLDILDRLPTVGAGFSWRTYAGQQPLPLLHAQTDHAIAVFTTRLGGRSSGALASLNLSFTMAGRYGEPEHADSKVRTNRRLVSRALFDGPARERRWARIRQVHGAGVAEASNRMVEADAIWTAMLDRPVAVLVADCVPVLLTAPGRVAAVHAGWRGMVAGVIGNAAEAIGGATEAFAGPAIGPCCFEVGPEVAQGFRDRFGDTTVTDDRHVDLWAAAEVAAAESGIASFAAASLCTSCHPELFFSHRRDNGRTGRQALMAALVGER